MNAPLTPGFAIGFAWMAWVASWLAAAAWTRTTLKRAGYWREFPGRFIVLIGGLLLFVPFVTGRSTIAPLWDVGGLGWFSFAGVAAGMAFAWWARIHLGALWSGTVTRKSDHRIVDSGPYAIVRHPIYSGMLLSLWMTALAVGRVEPLLGALMLSIGLWMQARLEERFLAQELGAAAYASYSARVPMLVPFMKIQGA
jgi:protein-S-isoprenylcysteine O-methyltransferase Ste14